MVLASLRISGHCVEMMSFNGYMCHQGRKGGGGLGVHQVISPCICLEMRLGERTRLTKFGELTQDRQQFYCKFTTKSFKEKVTFILAGDI